MAATMSTPGVAVCRANFKTYAIFRHIALQDMREEKQRLSGPQFRHRIVAHL